MNNGYIRVASIAPRVNVADVDYNVEQIIDMARKAADEGASIIVFPELSITGYTCGDLFHQSTLLKGALDGLSRVAKASTGIDALIVTGAPLRVEGRLYNCAVAISGGTLCAIVPKTYIPNYNEFYEKRWFASPDAVNCPIETTLPVQESPIPFGTDIVLGVDDAIVGIEICEDLWTPIPPSTHAALSGAQILLNLSASNDLIGKYDYLLSLIKQQSARSISAYVYSGAGFGESSTDLVFDGKTIIAENGTLLQVNDRWSTEPSCVIADVDIEAINRDRMHIMSFGDNAMRESARYRIVDTLVSRHINTDLKRSIDPHPFVPDSEHIVDRRCEEIINIQVAGLARRLSATHTSKLVIGISGGLDSTLALLVAVHTFDRLKLDRKGIVAVTMPGYGTTGRTYNNAMTLMKTLGVTLREISIVPAVEQHFKDIEHDPSVHDVTYENSQARERTQLLMDIANQVGGMVLGTGDLSELALGWATYNGDHMSMYGVNAGVPKTLVKYLVRWFAIRTSDSDEQSALNDIINTPISPELIPADNKGNIKQKTEDLVGPYELHDFFLYYTLRYGFSPRRIYYMACHAFNGVYDYPTIKHWLKTFCRRFFNQQFKRSCLPDGPKVGSVCLSPRGDWRMPSDASSALWLAECDSL